MDFGLKLSKREIESIKYLVETNKNMAHFEYKGETFYALIGKYESLATTFFGELIEAEDLKNAAVDYIMNKGLGASFYSTRFAIRNGLMKTNEFVMIYADKPIPKDLFVNANDFEFTEEPKRS